MSQPSTASASWLAWIRLARLSILPSAISNILMGFLLVNPSWQPVSCLLLLMAASSCLYSAGMILNDYFDLKNDQEHSPNRPIASGQISPGSALVAGIGLCLAGITLSGIAGSLGSGWMRPTIVSVVLCVCIWSYNSLLKKTPLAPIVMGLCRTLNVLLGASVLADEFLVHESSQWMGYSLLVWWVAGSIGIYVTGITVFARRERQVSTRVQLGTGLALMVVGIAGMSLVSTRDAALELIDRELFSGLFGLIILVIAVTIIRSAAVAVWSPKPAYIQKAVINALRSMILLDACIVFLFTAGQLGYTLPVASLLGVSLVLGRWIRGT